MKVELNTLRDLKEALKRLNGQELDQPIRIFPNEGALSLISELQIESEDFLVNKEDSDDFGSVSELEDEHGEEFERSNYYTRIPKGSVVFHSIEIEFKKNDLALAE